MENFIINKDTVVLKYEQFIPVTDPTETRSANDVYFSRYIGMHNHINSNYDPCAKQTSYLSSICDQNTQEYSLCNYIQENFNTTHEYEFNPKEWFVVDSSTQRLRAPRQNEFLFLLLEHPRYTSCIGWINKSDGLFKIHDPQRVAMLWSKVKNRKTAGIMNYDKFARAIRFYYKTGSMVKTHKKHTFRFKLSADGKP